MSVSSAATIVMIATTGLALGGGLGALIASRIIPAFGWRAVFYFGTLLAIVLAIAMWFRLTESIRYLVLRAPSEPRLRPALIAILHKRWGHRCCGSWSS